MSFQDPDSELGLLNRQGRAVAAGLHLRMRVLPPPPSCANDRPARSTRRSAREGSSISAALPRALPSIAQWRPCGRRASGKAWSAPAAISRCSVVMRAKLRCAIRPFDRERPSSCCCATRPGVERPRGRSAAGLSRRSRGQRPCAVLHDADALTKVVGVMGEAALPVLDHYGASAVLFRHGRRCVLRLDGGLRWSIYDRVRLRRPAFSVRSTQAEPSGIT